MLGLQYPEMSNRCTIVLLKKIFYQVIIKKCGLNSYLDSLADILQTPVMQVGHPKKAAVNSIFKGMGEGVRIVPLSESSTWGGGGAAPPFQYCR
jgi:hypothetical protein